MVHNTALNSSDNLLAYPPDGTAWKIAYWMRGRCAAVNVSGASYQKCIKILIQKYHRYRDTLIKRNNYSINNQMQLLDMWKHCVQVLRNTLSEAWRPGGLKIRSVSSCIHSGFTRRLQHAWLFIVTGTDRCLLLSASVLAVEEKTLASFIACCTCFRRSFTCQCLYNNI